MMRRPQKPPYRAGLLAILVIAIGTFFAFAREVPFREHYEVKAIFQTANNLKQNAPVRVAGIAIGKVVKVEHGGPGGKQALVTMRIDENGRPLHRDAEFKIRPRLFLEGNFFVDAKPGTPGVEELDDDEVVPVQQTQTPVQLGQIFTALQSDTRKNLKQVFREYDTALEGAGARGYRRSITYWSPAYRHSAEVNQATLGVEPRDLSGYIESAGRVARGLDRSPEALKSLITDFNTAAGAFAREATNLESAIGELPRTLRAAQPALAELNDSLPALRSFAKDLKPSIRETGRTLDVSIPFTRQVRLLVSEPELRGLTRDLRPTVPSLARLTRRSRPFYEQVRLSSNCENEVLAPWSNDKIQDPNFPATGRVFEEAPKPLVGLSGESRSADANGQYFHVLTSAGDRSVSLGGGQFAQALFPLLGTNPPKSSLPPFERDVACETQQTPDLRTKPGGAPPQKRSTLATPEARERYEEAKLEAVRWLRRQGKLEGLDLDVESQDATREQLLGGAGR